MPRGKQKKTMAGVPSQNIESVSGQRYGEGKAQTQMQKMMPAPDEMQAEQQRRPNVPAQQPQPQPVPQQVARPRVDPQQYLAQLPTGLLKQAPSQGVPVTNGLSSGPGAGREALRGTVSKKPSVRMLHHMYRRTGNRLYLDMMDRFN